MGIFIYFEDYFNLFYVQKRNILKNILNFHWKFFKIKITQIANANSHTYEKTQEKV